MTKDQSATWATVTLAAPQLIEWQIEGDNLGQSGKDVREFFKTMAKLPESREAVIRVNLVLNI